MTQSAPGLRRCAASESVATSVVLVAARLVAARVVAPRAVAPRVIVAKVNVVAVIVAKGIAQRVIAAHVSASNNDRRSACRISPGAAAEIETIPPGADQSRDLADAVRRVDRASAKSGRVDQENLVRVGRDVDQEHSGRRVEGVRPVLSESVIVDLRGHAMSADQGHAMSAGRRRAKART